MFPLSDGMPPRRFPVINVTIIAACFAVWIFYELPQPELCGARRLLLYLRRDRVLQRLSAVGGQLVLSRAIVFGRCVCLDRAFPERRRRPWLVPRC